MVHSPGMLTKVLCNFHILNSLFPIFKLWIGDFHSFHPICLSMFYIEIEDEMYCSQRMPTGRNLNEKVENIKLFGKLCV